MAGKKIAIIDTGTNSTRLLIAEVTNAEVRELERETAITRLGEKVDETGMLGEEARARVESCIAGYAARIRALQVERTVLLATSSVRDAVNGKSFIDRLAEGYGFVPRVLGGDEEANLAFAGATIDVRGKQVLLFDIGGGSTELVTGIAPSVSASVSIQIGCVRVRERFLGSDPVTDAEVAAARDYIEKVLTEGIAAILHQERQQTLAVAGTMTALAACDLGLESYSRAAVHGHVLSAARIRELLQELSAMSLAERVAIPFMEPGRADVITAGALIADVLMALAGIDAVTVCENDILDGAAMEFSRDM